MTVDALRALSRPVGDSIPPECLVFSCAEVIEGSDLSFRGKVPLYEAMRSRLSARTRSVLTLYPAFAYPRPEPRYISGPDAAAIESVREYNKRINAHNDKLPAAILCESSEVRVNGDIIHYFENGELRILYETCRFSDSHAAEAVSIYAGEADERMSEQGIYLHLASVGSHNYGHWLTDDLPRLKAFHALRHLYPRRTITIVMPSYNVTIDEVRLRTIRLYLGWDADWHVIFLHRDKVYSFPRLFHVTPCSQQPVAKSPDALDTVRKRMRQATSRIRRTALIERAKASPLALFRGAGRQVFIDRAEFRGRAIVNREEVLAIVLKRGFEVIDPEGMEPSEQVARFAAADFIVGIMGAAMTNTIFSRPGTRVVHLAPDAGWSDPFFWDLAAVCGHRYAVVYGRYDTAEGPDRLRNFIVDADRVEAALQAV